MCIIKSHKLWHQRWCTRVRSYDINERIVTWECRLIVLMLSLIQIPNAADDNLQCYALPLPGDVTSVTYTILGDRYAMNMYTLSSGKHYKMYTSQSDKLTNVIWLWYHPLSVAFYIDNLIIISLTQNLRILKVQYKMICCMFETSSSWPYQLCELIGIMNL